MWLTLFESQDGSAVSVEIKVTDAMSYSEQDFADLFMRTIYSPPGWGAKRKHKKEAQAWAKKQVEARAFLYKQAADAAL